MKLSFALLAFFISFSLAVPAFFYLPPAAARFKLLRALENEPVWRIKAQAEVQGKEFKIDLVSFKKNSENLVRISYAPIKIINNQWIKLEAGLDIFSELQLKKRLTTFKDLVSRLEQYEFEVNSPMISEFPIALKNNGVIFFDRRSGLPQKIELNGFEGFVAYDSPSGEEINLARPLAEVLRQFEELQKALNGKPKKLAPLGNPRAEASAFYADFDHDGVSDALEIFYGTDPANPDSDNDTFLDSDEIKRGYNPLGEGEL